MRSPPSYIDPAKVSADRVTFAWSSAIYDPILDPSGSRAAEYFTIKPQACAGLTAACAEWIAWRLARLAAADDLADLFARIDATWLAAGDPASVGALPDRTTTSPDENVDGVISTASILLVRAVEGLRERDTLVGLTTFGMAKLASHVGPRSLFGSWRTKMRATFAAVYRGTRDARGMLLTDPPTVTIAPAVVDGATGAKLAASREALLRASVGNPYLAKPKRARARASK